MPGRKLAIHAAVLAACSLCQTGTADDGLFLVAQPVADLRSRPFTERTPGVHDDGQETQLLYGEQVRVVREDRGWALVEAIEQLEFTHGQRWEGYPGWLPLTALQPAQNHANPIIVVTVPWAASAEQPDLRFAIGTRLAAERDAEGWRARLLDGREARLRDEDVTALARLVQLSPEDRRRRILHHASQLLGTPYVWGGRSPDGASGAGVDCSSLVHLAYRAAGVDIPRDAHEQFMRARATEALQPADLVFLSAAESPERIVHVMLYAGDGELIEAPGTGLAVRRITVDARLGVPAEELTPGMTLDSGQSVLFGAYIGGS